MCGIRRVVSGAVGESLRGLWLGYALHFVGVGAIALVACVMAVKQPGAQWGLLLLVCVLGGWVSSSLASNALLSAVLTRRGSRVSPMTQVLGVVCWSVANLVLMTGVVVALGFATGMLGAAA